VIPAPQRLQVAPFSIDRTPIPTAMTKIPMPIMIRHPAQLLPPPSRGAGLFIHDLFSFVELNHRGIVNR
jgi:hypothetical protein